MKRIINDEAIDRYLMHEVTLQGRHYQTIFRYSGTVKGDCHVFEAGFIFDGEEKTGTVYIPLVTDEGLLSKNGTLWYPVTLLIPPVHFIHGRRSYLNGCISDSPFASSLSDFYPDTLTMRPVIRTPLYESLYTDEPADVNDLYQWTVLDMAAAILELFNVKIMQDIRRSHRGGFKGITGTVQSIHTLIRAFSRYFGKDDEGIAESESVIVTDESLLGRRSIESKKNMLMIHPLIREVNIAGDSPVDFTGCSQSHPFTTAQIKDGIGVYEHHFVNPVDFPYARSRRDTIGIMNDDPRRMIVARSISRSMVLESPDIPYTETEYTSSDLDFVSLPGIHMTHPLNYEDGIIVSRTLAERMGAYKVYTDRFTVPKDMTVMLLKEPSKDGDYRTLAKEACHGVLSSVNTVRRGDTLAVIMTDTDATPVEVTSRVRHVSALVRVESFTPATDLAHESTVYQLTSVTCLPLTVGDKVSDAHGNKATVSAILPDEDMPIWEDIHCHYIASPYVMKRLAVGAEIEDKLALIRHHQRERGRDYVASLDSGETISMDEVNDELENFGLSYTGTVTFKGSEFRDVPVSYRKIFRLDNNAVETLSTKTGIAFNEGKRETRNIKLGLEILTFLSRGAHALTDWLIDVSALKEYTARHVVPLLYTFSNRLPDGASTFVISRKLPSELLGQPVPKATLTELDLTDTPCDDRVHTHYGIIRHGRSEIIVPPHNPFTDTGMGYVTVDTIAVAANRIIAEILSETAMGRSYTDVPAKCELYRKTLATLLTGKGGRIHEAVTPVCPTTIRGVASPFVSDDPLLIALPGREYRRLLKASAEFRDVYGNERRYCILKRDPVHRAQNIIGVRFTLWDEVTIGINPVLIRSLDADFDGDTVVALFPCDEKAYADIPKLVPDFEKIYSPSKQLSGTMAHEAVRELQARIGWTGTFENPHESDRLLNEELYGKLMAGMSQEELSEECIRAVQDFDTIKTGTALTGALALRFIYSRDHGDSELLQAACQLYHLMAQDTLDAKSGKAVTSLAVVEAFNAGKVEELESLLHTLGCTHEGCIEELKTFCKEVQAAGSMAQYLRKHHPVLGAIQRSAGMAECRALVDWILSGKGPGTGIWEVLFNRSMEKDGMKEEEPITMSGME